MNGIPVRRIFRITWIGTLAVLLLTFFLGGSAPMLINGENYADWLWLKLSDMFVITSLLMLVEESVPSVSVPHVIFGRKTKRECFRLSIL